MRAAALSPVSASLVCSKPDVQLDVQGRWQASNAAAAPLYFGKSVAKELSSNRPDGLSSLVKGSTFQ